jgi:hypothetical protein
VRWVARGHGGCRLGGRGNPTVKDRYPRRCLAKGRVKLKKFDAQQIQRGCLAGAARVLKDNARVVRAAHWGQKPRVEHKGKRSLDCGRIDVGRQETDA